jgi:hypothetical protein
MLRLQLRDNGDRDLIGIHRAKDLRMNALYVERGEIIRGLAGDRKRLLMMLEIYDCVIFI